MSYELLFTLYSLPSTQQHKTIDKVDPNYPWFWVYCRIRQTITNVFIWIALQNKSIYVLPKSKSKYLVLTLKSSKGRNHISPVLAIFPLFTRIKLSSIFKLKMASSSPAVLLNITLLADVVNYKGRKRVNYLKSTE